MAPQPPTSSGQTSMGPPPPPPPAASNNVTFVLINQSPSQTNLMRPPVEPPPRRGRGRGRGRGGSTSPSESGRGRGRGRGRGTSRPQPPPVERMDPQVNFFIFVYTNIIIFQCQGPSLCLNVCLFKQFNKSASGSRKQDVYYFSKT